MIEQRIVELDAAAEAISHPTAPPAPQSEPEPPLVEVSEAGDLAPFIEPAEARMRRRKAAQTVREVEATTPPEAEAVTSWHEGDTQPIRAPQHRGLLRRLIVAILRWAERTRDDRAEAEELPEELPEAFDPLDAFHEDDLPSDWEPDSKFVQAARIAGQRAEQNRKRERHQEPESAADDYWQGPSGPSM